MRLIMALADRANQYVEERKPWELRKDPARAGELQDVCTIGLNLFRQLVVYLAPVLPRLAEQTGELCSASRSSTGTNRRRRWWARRSASSST